ncbi:hypothetical protein B0A50_01134 [Salinomyces thailandicus]|uniref:Nudix hydrolase domain-containing protein n=1 Tax=Salinomyces thailandicus TaxID=706561 RepID=A0A4U0UBY4_9PEZI|nr:hypothetical protein B0A50_01134 [Salinomyces thailandica]
MAQDKPKAPERSMEARVGRDNQRYGPSGERLVAGVVPLSPNRTQVLLIQSSTTTTKKGWVLPKGGWELDEPLCTDAATREAWEEAGIECEITRDLGEIEEQRTEAQIVKLREKYGVEAPRARYRFYEVRVREEKGWWPEQWKRERRWMGYAEARECLRERPELLEALERSGIVKGER